MDELQEGTSWEWLNELVKKIGETKKYPAVSNLSSRKKHRYKERKGAWVREKEDRVLYFKGWNDITNLGVLNINMFRYANGLSGPLEVTQTS